MTRHINHRAAPGPMYWDFKCLRCDGLVDEHLLWPQRVWRSVFVPGKETEA